MRFINIKAENVYSFKKLEFNFNYRGTTLIVGKNKDQDTANGAGKTSILKVLYLGLWGKELYGESLDGVVNRNSDNGFLIDLNFEDRGHSFRIVRYRDRKDKDAKTGIDFYIDGQLMPGENASDVQKMIEHKIKISPKLFVSSIMTAQNSTSHFLTANDTEKKEVFSELLDLTIYSKAFDLVKKQIDGVEDQIEQINSKIENFLEQIEDRTKEVSELELKNDKFEDEKILSVKKISDKISLLKQELKTQSESDKEKLKQLNEKLEKANSDILKLKKKKTDFESKLQDEDAMRELKSELNQEKSGIDSKIDRIKEQIEDLEEEKKELNKRYTDPNKFEQKLDKMKIDSDLLDNLIRGSVIEESINDAANTLINSAKDTIIEYDAKTVEKNKKLDEKKEKLKDQSLKIIESRKNIDHQIQKLDESIKTFSEVRCQKTENDNLISKSEKTKNELSIEIAKLGNVEKAIEKKKKEILDLEKTASDEKEKVNPYKELIEVTKNKIVHQKGLVESNRKVIKTLENELRQLNFWKGAFSPLGIRSFIFDEVVDLLNQKVQTILNDLFDGALNIIFKSDGKNSKGTLNNKITTLFYLNGKETTFGLLSGGEQRRAILAVNLALTEIAEIYSGIVMNIKFLDEPFDGIDGQGQIKCFKLFARLAQNKDGFFVISHDQSFQQLCPNTIYIIKEKEESRIVSRNEFDSSKDLEDLLVK